ncbi:MAG: hypothetical protein M0P31_01650 [Solirubrobacteraceae bacterium]|nr:hypothetical protein [Solirubrobacteraceae bacterium]
MPRRRPSLPLIAVVLGGVLAGCGGDGDADAYAKTYQAACQTLTDEVAAYQRSVTDIAGGATKDPSAAVKGYKDASVKLFDAFLAQIDAMSDADAPDEFRDFQGQIEKDLKAARQGIEEARTAVAGVGGAKDLRSIGTKLNGIKVETKADLPDELAEKAPACKVLGRSS